MSSFISIYLKMDNNDNKCRICFESKRNLCSVFETDQGLSYALMIALITGIKIVKDKKELLCLLCRRKLKDFYEFKLLIERSDVELSKQSKVFKFNTIDEIKVEFDSQLNHIEPENVASDYNNLFKNENDWVYYNNTLIKRLIKQERITVPIEEFLDTIKSEGFEENGHVDDYVQDSNMGEEYSFKRKKKPSKMTKNYKTSNKTVEPLKDVNIIRVKPIMLKDIRLLKTIVNSVGKKKKTKRKKKERLCPFCGKICKSLKTHILIHTAEKKFKCQNCTKSFRTMGNLRYHIKKSHSTIEEKYKCEHCINTFSCKGSIMRHMVTHMKRQFACTLCKKEFRLKYALKRHMMSHGIGARTIQCDMCTMTFYSNDHLKAHYRVHTRERPYNCELCSQPYSYKRDFNRHCLKKHGVIIDRRPVHVMNDEVLKCEKALMKNLMLRLHGLPTESEPMNSFQGPQKALAFAKAVKVMQNGQIPIDVQL
ncbi:zinc finger protein 729-like isoform X2 [Maniola jurtina]|uniref:zinc finger protein 729-like isoform X2 n=1 Tax=Maniola jurtina TaxID=191418 RepID=UPI001E68E336|nr:zinc finger protein 729-like isoform X2 [Maniola jurtina]